MGRGCCCCCWWPECFFFIAGKSGKTNKDYIFGFMLLNCVSKTGVSSFLVDQRLSRFIIVWLLKWPVRRLEARWAARSTTSTAIEETMEDHRPLALTRGPVLREKKNVRIPDTRCDAWGAARWKWKGLTDIRTTTSSHRDAASKMKALDSVYPASGMWRILARHLRRSVGF